MNLGGTSGLVFRAKAYVDQLKERGLKTNCLNSETDTTNMERAEHFDGMNMQTFLDIVGLSWDVIAVHIKHNCNPDQLCPTAL